MHARVPVEDEEQQQEEHFMYVIESTRVLTCLCAVSSSCVCVHNITCVRVQYITCVYACNTQLECVVHGAV